MDIEKKNKQKETADYIHRITTDLCQMASKEEMAFLAYILDMARIESYDMTNKIKGDTNNTCP